MSALDEMEERNERNAYDRGYAAGMKDETANSRIAESDRWASALNALISTESVRFSPTMVDMVYSYRVAQIVDSLRVVDES